MDALGDYTVTEFRIVLPLDLEEFRIGQLWSVAEASKNETGGGEGIEIVVNEPFDESRFPDVRVGGKHLPSGQYTHKIFHLAQKVPAFIRMLAPKGSLEIHEKAWNSYPYCRTVYSNPDYMKEGFYIVIDSIYVVDRGTTDNIHKLSGTDLVKRKVVNIDVANDPMIADDDKPEWDPCKVRSEKADRGPLPSDGDGSWKSSVEPVMCCYKLVKVNFDWWGLKMKVESVINRAQHRLFRNFHRQVVCWLDNYYGMTVDEVRAFEDKTRKELEEMRRGGNVTGMVEK